MNVFVNSTQRQKGENNSFTIFLQPALNLTRLNTAWEVRLISAIVPFSFTQIDSTDNKLYGFIDTTPWTITVPEGNYTITELINTVKPLIETAAGVTLTWFYTRATCKCTLKYTSGTGTLRLSYSSSKVIMEMFGFTADVVLTAGGVKESDRGVNVNPIQSIYIRSSTLTQAGSKEFLLSQNEVCDILCEIPVMTTPFSFIYYTNPANIGVRLMNRTIDAIELYLSTNVNYTLSLNQQPWSCMLNFSEVPLDIREETATVQSLLRSLPPTKDEQEAKLEELQKQREEVLRLLEAEKEKILRSIKDGSKSKNDAEDA